MNDILRVLVSGAAGQIAYSLYPYILNGSTFGSNKKIHLVMYDLSFTLNAMEAVKMELEDCCFEKTHAVECITDPKSAFTNADVIILLGSKPRGPNQERKDLLKDNADIFKEQGLLIDKFASKNVKVIVVGNPANTNCLITLKHAPSIPAKNFTCLTMLDHNRTKAHIGKKLHIESHKIKNVFVWGNHSSTQFPFIKNTTHMDYNDLLCQNYTKAECDELIQDVRARGYKIIEGRKLSSALSAAKAISDHLFCWFNGSKNDICSFGIYSDGTKYNVPKDIVYSFPLKCYNAEYEIVENITLTEEDIQLIQNSAKELLEERQHAFEHLKIPID